MTSINYFAIYLQTILIFFNSVDVDMGARFPLLCTIDPSWWQPYDTNIQIGWSTLACTITCLSWFIRCHWNESLSLPRHFSPRYSVATESGGQLSKYKLLTSAKILSPSDLNDIWKMWRQFHSIHKWIIILVSSKFWTKASQAILANAFISPCRTDVLDNIAIWKYFEVNFGVLKDVN